jgi:hypothetical protein
LIFDLRFELFKLCLGLLCFRVVALNICFELLCFYAVALNLRFELFNPLLRLFFLIALHLGLINPYLRILKPLLNLLYLSCLLINLRLGFDLLCLELLNFRLGLLCFRVFESLFFQSPYVTFEKQHREHPSGFWDVPGVQVEAIQSKPSSQANRTSQWILGRIFRSPSQARRTITEGQGDHSGYDTVRVCFFEFFA